MRRAQEGQRVVKHGLNPLLLASQKGELPLTTSTLQTPFPAPFLLYHPPMSSSSTATPSASTTKGFAPPPTAAELDAFTAQANLSASILRNMFGKMIPGWKPKTEEEYTQEEK